MNKQKTSRKKYIVLALLVLIAAGLVFTALARWQSANDTSKKTTKAGSTINYNPPTKQEQQAGTDQKTTIVEQSNDSKTTITSAVTPYISYAGQSGNIIEVSAYVSGVAEDGGTCTLVAKNGSSSITKSNPALMNASTTTCKSFTVDRSEFSRAGNWEITVSYASSTSSGTSAVGNLVIK